MNKRQLGNSDLQVAPLSFGGNVFGWTIDQATSFEILDGFIESGFNFIDTADVYSNWVPGNKGGESEIIIGNWIKSRNNREKLIIATKVGGDMGQGKVDLSKKYIIKAVEDSLLRLQTDYIDLYQSHWDDQTTPIEETLETYAQLVAEGKIRWIGASNFTTERLKLSLEASKKHGFPRYQTFQPLYNLYDREEFEKELQSFCVNESIGVISYFSLASGFLSGKYRSEADLSKSQRGGGVKHYLNERGLSILTALDTVAADYSSTPSSVAIAWLLTRPAISAPIASATNLTQLNALTEAVKLELKPEAIELLTAASAW